MVRNFQVMSGSRGELELKQNPHNLGQFSIMPNLYECLVLRWCSRQSTHPGGFVVSPFSIIRIHSRAFLPSSLRRQIRPYPFTAHPTLISAEHLFLLNFNAAFDAHFHRGTSISALFITDKGLKVE